jgi:VanZ family protein
MKRGFQLHVLPALIYVLVLFWLGAIRTGFDLPQSFIPQDKLKHFGAFALLVFLLLRAFRFEFPAAANGRLIGLSMVGSSAIGAMLELWQCLFPYRSAEFADWVADTLGALLAGFLANQWLRRRGRVRVPPPG